MRNMTFLSLLALCLCAPIGCDKGSGGTAFQAPTSTITKGGSTIALQLATSTSSADVHLQHVMVPEGVRFAAKSLYSGVGVMLLIFPSKHTNTLFVTANQMAYGLAEDIPFAFVVTPVKDVVDANLKASLLDTDHLETTVGEEYYRVIIQSVVVKASGGVAAEVPAKEPQFSIIAQLAE